MNEVVIVTTWNREELLWLSLEAIRRDDPDITVCVFTDKGADSVDLRKTCSNFNAIVGDGNASKQNKTYGNSFNLLMACDWAVNLRPGHLDIVHLIEDDTIIHPGYLAWARAKLQETKLTINREGPSPVNRYAVVCGRIGSPHIPHWYESTCASWNADCLRTAIAHVVPEYFSSDRKEMQRVMDEVIFPKSKYKRGGAEQDGFFLRCVEHHGWETCFPPKPLASHQGSWGYNMPIGYERPKGTFEERVQWCRDLLQDRERRKHIFGHAITQKEMDSWDGKTEPSK